MAKEINIVVKLSDPQKLVELLGQIIDARELFSYIMQVANPYQDDDGVLTLKSYYVDPSPDQAGIVLGQAIEDWLKRLNALEDSLDDRPLYDRAVELVVRSGRSSIAHLQRKLKLGYTEAYDLQQELIGSGILGDEHEKSKPHRIVFCPNCFHLPLAYCDGIVCCRCCGYETERER